jgi:hypothetical protein
VIQWTLSALACGLFLLWVMTRDEDAPEAPQTHNATRSLLQWLVARIGTPRVIYDRDGGSPYLSRWYLIGIRRSDDDRLTGQLADTAPDHWLARLPFNLFLHRFHRSDDDGALHSHPWSWAVSLVLVGGYREERRVGDSVISRVVKPWSINFLRGEDYHRVDLLEEDAWSLFLVGPKVSTWFFWQRETCMRAQWRRFINAKRYGTDAGWESDTRETAP